MANNALPDSIPTIPEFFTEAGYNTAGLTPNPHLCDETNLDRSFDRFSYVTAKMLSQDVGLRTLKKYLLNIRRHSADFSTTKQAHSTAYLMHDVRKRRVFDLSGGDDPFFLYSHYMEPHHPYYAPLPYLDQFTDDLNMSARGATEIGLEIFDEKRPRTADG